MDEEFQLAPTYQHEKAHWGWRVAAYLIDMLLITLIVFLILAIHPDFGIAGALITLILPVVPAIWWLFFLYGAICLVYFSVMESAFQATVGKYVANLRVYALDGELRLSACIVRNISKFWWVMTLSDFLLGVSIYKGAKQRVFDTVANTIVVDVVPAPEPEPVYIPEPVYAPPPPPPEPEVEYYTIDEMPEEWLQHGNCLRCGTPYKIVKEEHQYKLVGPWMNRCTWCNRLLTADHFGGESEAPETWYRSPYSDKF